MALVCWCAESRSFARFMRGERSLVGTELVATSAVAIVRLEVSGSIAEWDVRGELALQAEVESSWNTVTAARHLAFRRRLLFLLLHSTIE